MLRGDLNGHKIQKRGDICICMADSLCCTAKNITVKQPYFNNIFLKEYIEILDRLITGSKKASLIKKTKTKKPPYK